MKLFTVSDVYGTLSRTHHCIYKQDWL